MKLERFPPPNKPSSFHKYKIQFDLSSLAVSLISLQSLMAIKRFNSNFSKEFRLLYTGTSKLICTLQGAIYDRQSKHLDYRADTLAVKKYKCNLCWCTSLWGPHKKMCHFLIGQCNAVWWHLMKFRYIKLLKLLTYIISFEERKYWTVCFSQPPSSVVACLFVGSLIQQQEDNTMYYTGSCYCDCDLEARGSYWQQI